MMNQQNYRSADRKPNGNDRKKTDRPPPQKDRRSFWTLDHI